MTGSKKEWRLAGAALLVPLAILAAVFWFDYSRKSKEERRLHAVFAAILSAKASARYEALSLGDKLAVARRTVRELARLRPTGWRIYATDLLSVPGKKHTHELIYRLGVGATELSDCIVWNPLARRAGSCASFTYAGPDAAEDTAHGGAPAGRSQRRPLDLYLGKPPYVTSPGRLLLMLGPGGSFPIEGRVTLDARDFRVSDAMLLMPDPNRPAQPQRLPLADFSLRGTLELKTVKRFELDFTRSLPAGLAPLYPDAPMLTVLRVEAAVAVDLRRPGYRLEGRLTLLNQVVREGIVDYYPGQYASIYATSFHLPTGFPGVCLPFRSAFLEVDFARQRLRLSGQSEITSVDSLLCAEGPANQTAILRPALEPVLRAARSNLKLATSIEASADLVVDIGASILCADIAANGRSIIHAAYLGNVQTFQMWAPKSFTARGVTGENLFGSSVAVLAEAQAADYRFPESIPMRCWDGDTGPRTDLRFDLLAPSSALKGARQE